MRTPTQVSWRANGAASDEDDSDGSGAGGRPQMLSATACEQVRALPENGLNPSLLGPLACALQSSKLVGAKFLLCCCLLNLPPLQSPWLSPPCYMEAVPSTGDDLSSA